MTRPLKQARCHPELPNFYFGKCESCYALMKDPEVICKHDDRPKNRMGRCSSCWSRYYAIRRKNNKGDAFGSIRQTIGRVGVSAETREEMRNIMKTKHRLSHYSLSLSDYDALFNKQNGLCAICRLPSSKKLCVDHDHGCCSGRKKSCGKCIRGLVCHGCNSRLGQIESPLLARSIEYLLRYKGGPLGIPNEEKVSSATGGAKGKKLARFDLIPPRSLWELAEAYGRGEEKYGDGNNWRKGYEWSLSYAAMMRHATQFWAGQSRDPTNGNHHLAAVAWHAFTMMEWDALGAGTDDRSPIG